MYYLQHIFSFYSVNICRCFFCRYFYFCIFSPSLSNCRGAQLEEVDKQMAEQDLAPTLSHNVTLSCSKAQSEMRGTKLSLIIAERRGICLKKKGREKWRRL